MREIRWEPVLSTGFQPVATGRNGCSFFVTQFFVRSDLTKKLSDKKSSAFFDNFGEAFEGAFADVVLDAFGVYGGCAGVDADG